MATHSFSITGDDNPPASVPRGTQGFTILSVTGDTSVDTLKEAINVGKIPWKCWWDAENEIARAWNVRSWPTVYLIDRKGVIRFKGMTGSKLEEAVKALLNES